MSGLRDLAKGGWHPKGKEGGKESWRGDFKGVDRVAGWMGKGKSPSEAAQEHQSAPLSTLKDPASFGPPPKRVNYSASGGPLSAASHEGDSARPRLQAKREGKAAAAEEASKPPPGPYRADTTGLNTAHLPKPPVFRPGQSTPPPPAVASNKPQLPPRLPPRQNAHPDVFAQAPPPPYTETAQQETAREDWLNQGAIDRLGQAGVSVPGLDIGRRTASPPVPPRRGSQWSTPPPTHPQVPGNGAPQLSELQSRFASMSASPTDAQRSGTSWADKKAALNTVNTFRSDPSKVSLSDMRATAATANNFRERHGEQAAAGWREARSISQQYGVADSASNSRAQTSPLPSPASPTAGGLGKRPPPPPPPQRRELSSNPGQPPPVPLGSKPKF